MSASGPMPVVLIEWRPLVKGHLLGFAKIQLGALKISDVAVLCNTGRKWCNLPSKPMMDQDGTAKRDDGGKIKYVPLLEWSNKDTADRFSVSVIAAILEKHPDAFN